MKWAYSIVSVLILCLFSMFALFFFEEATISNEQDYYLMKENVEAAMFDSVDIAYYRDTGKIKISKEKFVENFIRRFAENGKLGTYKIDYYDIMEEPPKVTVKITDRTDSYNIYTNMTGNTNNNNSTSVNVVNDISGIIETKDCYITKTLYSSPDQSSSNASHVSMSGNYIKNGDLIYQIDGYKPIRAQYVMSWYDYAMTYATENTKEGRRNALMDVWERYNDLYYDTYNRMNREIDTETVYWNTTARGTDYNGLDGIARVSMNNFGIVYSGDGVRLKYEADYACSSLVYVKTFGGSHKWVCNMGVIFDVIYKSTSDRCVNQ